MKCARCGNEVKVKEAKFCPFCGQEIEQCAELAGYTRLQFFSAMGDTEFQNKWDEVKSMSAAEALAWLREKPPVHYVYRFFGEWEEPDKYKKRGVSKRSGFICNGDISYVAKHGSVTVKRSKLVHQIFGDIGTDAFWTREECEAAIKEEIEKC